MCKWHDTYLWKVLDEGYNFALYLTLIGGMYIKLWASKGVGDLISRILKLPFGNPGTK
jgi:hypothetical protein